MYHSDDTIAAIATASPGAARGIIRTSGPAVVAILESCFQPFSDVVVREIRSPCVLAGTLTLAGTRPIRLPADVYLWPGPQSYTRQPAAEIHTIGSPPLLSAALETLCAAGARLAEPGEFTLRAFLAGRIDLTQAEAVLGVIDARGQRQFERALAQLAGGLARPLHALREGLLDLLAELEAGLDFAEEDIQFIAPGEIGRRLGQAAEIVARLGEQLTARRMGDSLPRAVLLGRPNVGKSSLFNALTAPGGALVSDQPGTTRDYLVATLDLGAVRCQLVDTAGFDPLAQGGDLDAIAGRLAAVQLQDCDVRLLCLDASRPLVDWERHQMQANPSDQQIVVLTKCDAPRRAQVACAAVETSAANGQGIVALRQRLCDAASRVDQGDSADRLTAERCGESLRAAAESLDRACELNRSSGGSELIAAEVRGVLAELGRVVGAVYTDDILDRVFGRFCIGK